jgi:hypothetical protein
MLHSGLDAHPTLNILRIKLTQLPQEARDG